MASQAVSGVGTIFHKWNGSAWVTISEITSIKGPGMKRDTIEVTSMDSLGGYKEFIAGFRDSGTISLSMNFTRDGYDALKFDFESNELSYYEIVLPDADITSFEFSGLVTEVPLTIGAKDAITMDVSIQISGPIIVNDGRNLSSSLG